MLRHYTAVKSRLVSILPVAIKVADTALLDEDGVLFRGQYVILFGGGPDVLDDGRLTAPQRADSDAEFLYTARCVAVTADGARGVAQQVLSALVGFTPTIADRNCQSISLDDSSDVQPDSALKQPLWYMDLDFILSSSRA
jgi:hypothetical protein